MSAGTSLRSRADSADSLISLVDAVISSCLRASTFGSHSGLRKVNDDQRVSAIQSALDNRPVVALELDMYFNQKFPLTFELANLATTVGVRHGLVSLGAQQYYSGGCLVGETTVKGGMLFERVLIGYGPEGNISASSGLFIFLDMAR